MVIGLSTWKGVEELWPPVSLQRCVLTCFFIGVLVLFCQLIVRGWAKRRSQGVQSRLGWLQRGLVIVAWPVLAPVRRLAFYCLPQKHGVFFWTAGEFERVSSAAATEDLAADSKKLLRAMIEFSDTIILEIMVPRTEMIAIPMSATEDEVRAVVLEAGHSRIPVYDGTIDNILGLLHVKKLYAAEFSVADRDGDGEFQVKNLLRPVFYVPEIMKISELLKDFQKRKTHLAIVVDEYGGTAGVVTLEDILEEIVGDIQDEDDVEERQFRVVGDNKIVADGRVDLDELEAALGIEFPHDIAYETLAGFVTAKIGYLAEAGTVLKWGELTITVKEADARRISVVELQHREAFVKRP
ncbi:MAG: hemolysin family protein [Myxococcota bacterium]|nr:hemolysin family protein [Myxococcota bacterium]